MEASLSQDKTLLASIKKHLDHKINMIRQKQQVFQEIMEKTPVYNMTTPISKMVMYFCICSLSMCVNYIHATSVDSRHLGHQV